MAAAVAPASRSAMAISAKGRTVRRTPGQTLAPPMTAAKPAPKRHEGGGRNRLRRRRRSGGEPRGDRWDPANS